MNNAKVKKILNVVVNVVLILFLVVCVLAVSVTIFASRDVDGAVTVFGHKMMIVTSGSMEKSEHTDVSNFEIKSIPIRSMIFVETVPEDAADAYAWYQELKVGDVLTFKYVESNKQVTITHRITSIKENGVGGFVIELMGDNKNSADGAMVQRIDTSVNNSNFVIGKVTGKSVVFGNIITLLKSPLGIVLLIIIPCFLIIAYEAFKIWRIVQEDKKAKANETLSEKEREIEELKRKLAEMSGQTEAEKPNDDESDVSDEAAPSEEVLEGDETVVSAEESPEDASAQENDDSEATEAEISENEPYQEAEKETKNDSESEVEEI